MDFNLSPYLVDLRGQGRSLLHTLTLWGEAKAIECFHNGVRVLGQRRSSERRPDHLAVFVDDKVKAPEEGDRFGSENDTGTAVGPRYSIETPRRKELGFQGPDPFPFTFEDEVKVPKADCCFGNLIGIVANHPKSREFVENVQAPYLALQLSVF